MGIGLFDFSGVIAGLQPCAQTRLHGDEHGRRGLPIAVGSHSLKRRIDVDGGADGIIK